MNRPNYYRILVMRWRHYVNEGDAMFWPWLHSTCAEAQLTSEHEVDQLGQAIRNLAHADAQFRFELGLNTLRKKEYVA